MTIFDTALSNGHDEPDGDLTALVGVAREAVDLAVERLRTREPGSVTAKGDRDMVSDADLAIEHLVRAFLANRTPHIGFLGEETGSNDHDEQRWVLDPIDGTANYVRGLPLHAVSLALCRGGCAAIGVIAVPALQVQYWAATGMGAHRDLTQVAVRSTATMAEAIVAVGDYGTGPDAASRNRADHALHRLLAPVVQRVRMLGSAALDLVWVAEGCLDASITLGNRAWDMAAGTIIAREAGALVLDADGSSHNDGSSVTIAVTPTLAREVTALVAAALAHGEGTPESGGHGRTSER